MSQQAERVVGFAAKSALSTYNIYKGKAMRTTSPSLCTRPAYVQENVQVFLLPRNVGSRGEISFRLHCQDFHSRWEKGKFPTSYSSGQYSSWYWRRASKEKDEVVENMVQAFSITCLLVMLTITNPIAGFPVENPHLQETPWQRLLYVLFVMVLL